GYDEVYIIDAVVVENGKIGELYEYNFNDFNKYLHLSSPHTFNLPTALKMVELYGQLPKIIKIYGINIENKLEFSEEFSEGIKNKIDEITEKIIKNIEELKNSCLEI
nr:hydrogenase maturation protease [Candidatus Dependentiae bacterium]